MKPDTRDSKPRVAAHRARLREQGLRPLEVWAYPEDHARIKDFVREISRAQGDSESSQGSRHPLPGPTTP